jgi:hypothetical protein
MDRILLKLAGFAIATLGSGLALAGRGPDLPDLAPVPVNITVDRSPFRCSNMPTFEFDVLTANIGGQDWVRPRSPDRGGFILRQIYEYQLYQLQQVGTDDDGNPIYDYVFIPEVSHRKNTICIQDDGGRGNIFPCLQQHDPFFDCGATYGRQGVSVGWSDSYFRGLTGQLICLNSYTGSFKANIHLDPDSELDPNDPTLFDNEVDATHDNNMVDVYFDWDGAAFSLTDIQYGGGFDPSAVCPM